ncbi:hypothetical protein BGX27_010718 [Mortierella sp. AM989]|nr:hypothetical protein BGX27_010718 [Mortierella sp. AM989]
MLQLTQKDRTTWQYLITAIEYFPRFDEQKTIRNQQLSHRTICLCHDVDRTPLSGQSRVGSKSHKESDLVLELKNANKTVCDLGIGEVASHTQRNHAKMNSKDLVRVGLALKEALDLIQDEFGVEDAVLPGWQVIDQAMTIYLMCRCGNMYIMFHVRSSTTPDNLTDLGTFGNDIKTWVEMRATIEQGLASVPAAQSTG